MHTHCQFTQSSVSLHGLPHEPQFRGFWVMSSQPLPQSMVPLGHTHWEPEQSLPPVQAVVQSPQCSSSERVLKQPSAHFT